MKTCLGSLLLLPTIVAILATVVYHASVNGELRFEQRDTNTEYINTNRSYRPPAKREQAKPAARPELLPVNINLKDDDTPEEA